MAVRIASLIVIALPNRIQKSSDFYFFLARKTSSRLQLVSNPGTFIQQQDGTEVGSHDIHSCIYKFILRHQNTTKMAVLVLQNKIN